MTTAKPRLRPNPVSAGLAANLAEQVVQIFTETARFYLREPINLDVRQEQGTQIVAYAPIGIRGYGHSYEEALESFADQFRSAWFQIAAEADRNLTGEARTLKRTMLALVEAVE